MSSQPDVSRLSQVSRRAYEQGIAIAKKKLAGCHVQTANEIHLASIAKGKAEIIQKFGSQVAMRFNISSPRHVPSPDSELEQAARIGASRALKKAFMSPSRAPSRAPSSPSPASSPKTFKSGVNTIKRLSCSGGLWGRLEA